MTRARRRSASSNAGVDGAGRHARPDRSCSRCCAANQPALERVVLRHRRRAAAAPARTCAAPQHARRRAPQHPRALRPRQRFLPPVARPGHDLLERVLRRRGRALARRRRTRKYDRMLDELARRAGHRVLEIGCGWGGFRRARGATRGCHVTGAHHLAGAARLCARRASTRRDSARSRRPALLRLSRQRRAVRRASSRSRCSRPWASATGRHTFARCASALQPGRARRVQSISIAEDAFERYRSAADFIQQYIFPGGMLPSVARFVGGGAQARGWTRAPFRLRRATTPRRCAAGGEQFDAQRRRRSARSASTTPSSPRGASTSPTARRASNRAAST